MGTHVPIHSLEVAATFKAMPLHVRQKLLAIRSLIYELAASNASIGTIEECLKWGDISYLTKKPKSGTTIRLGYKAASLQYAIYVPCQTSLIEDFKETHTASLTFQKNRAILFNAAEMFPTLLVKKFLSNALTYHLK